MTSYLLQAVTAFGAGLGVSLSPCIYPMIPISVGFLGASTSAKGTDQKLRVLGFFLGQVSAFTLLGIVAVLIGEILGFSSQIPWVQIATGVLLIAFALASFFDYLPAFMSGTRSGGKLGSGKTVFGAFLVGVSSAAVASPCTTPVVGGLLAAVSQVDDRLWGITLMLFFAIGLSFLFLLIGLGLSKVKSLPKAGRWMERVHKASSVLLLIGGTYFIIRGASLV